MSFYQQTHSFSCGVDLHARSETLDSDSIRRRVSE